MSDEAVKRNPGARSRADWQRRRRLAAIFGDDMPTVTSDEMADGGDRADGSSSDRWLRENRPPHHE